MEIAEALEESLLTRNLPLVTEYDIFLTLCHLYHSKSFDGQPIQVDRPYPDRQAVLRACSPLLENRFIAKDKNFHRTYRIRAIGPRPYPEEIACYIDPFCYVSHLSAMESYGLTDRSPHPLILTTPNQTLWPILRQKKMDQDYRQFPVPAQERTPLERVQIPTIHTRPIRQIRVKELGRFLEQQEIPIREAPTRLATIGQTFLDMLLHPNLCGGMMHVVDVWEEHAEISVKEIIAAVDSTQKNLTKIRAGYLLDEVLGLSHPVLDTWRELAQSGGSRKLDPSHGYVNRHSENWMISINC